MIKQRLASSIGRRDEEPNLALANEIVKNKDQQSINDLIQLLKSKQKELQNDSIKVLYEVGELSPALIEEFLPEFIEALKSQNNRLQWGAMTALKTISLLKSEEIFKHMPILEQAVEQGSVIIRDNYVAILVNLLDQPGYDQPAFDSLISQLKDCPTNQFAMYAEMSASKIKTSWSSQFRETILLRIDEIEKLSKRKRLEKVLKKLG